MNKLQMKHMAELRRRVANQKWAYAYMFHDSSKYDKRCLSRIYILECLEALHEAISMFSESKEMSYSESFNKDVNIAMDEILGEIIMVEELIEKMGEAGIKRKYL